MQRGEVWWGDPPLPGGSRKRRPYLIVSLDAFNRNERYRKVMVVHLTTAPRAGEPFRWEVEVPRDVAGLPATSIVKCNEIYTLLKVHLSVLAGTLPRPYVERVDRALVVALGLVRSR